LKLISFFLALIILIVAFILNFEYQFSYLFFFTLTIAFIGMALFQAIAQFRIKALKKSNEKLKVKAISTHDSINSMLSLGIMISDLDDPEEIKKKVKAHTKKFGMDLSQLDFTEQKDILDYRQKMEKKIETFINTKTVKWQNEIDIEISYYKDCEKLDNPQLILEWLGTLLDNAIEAAISHPIFIYISSTKHTFRLRMANEYLSEKEQDIKQIFEKGYSTKSEGCGIGLHNLYEEVNGLGGEIEVDEYYNEIYSCHYLQLSIEFKREVAC
jgi:hypothetical protein